MPSAPELLGRQAELAELTDALDAAADDMGSTILVCGEPGIGKTRLTQAVAARATERGFTVAATRCWEADGSPAFWPWIQLGRSVLTGASGRAIAGAMNLDLGQVVDMLPHGDVLGPALGPAADAPHERFRLFDQIATLIRSASPAGPFLFTLDDLHWADHSTLLLLEFLSHELSETPVVLLGTFRDAEVDGERARLLETVTSGRTVVRLRGLDSHATAALLGHTLGSEPDTALAANVHHRSAGNPLFVQEFARLLRARSDLSTAVPDGIRPVLERRLARVSNATSDLLGVAAVAGEIFQLGRVLAAAGIETEDALALIDEATAKQVVSEQDTPGSFAFTHALMRDALYDALPLSTRTAIHRRLAEVIEATGTDEDAAEIAHHYQRAGLNRLATSFAERAGDRALRLLAFDEASRHYGHAIEALTGSDLERRLHLLMARGAAAVAGGDIETARSSYAEAARLAREHDRPQDLGRAALGFGAGLSGFEVQLLDQQQIDLLEEALKAQGPDDTPLKAWILGRLSVALSFVESSDRRLELATEAVAMARRMGHTRALAAALAAHCDAIAGPDATERRLQQAEEIVRLAVGDDDRPMELLGLRHKMVAVCELGDFDDAREVLRRYERLSDAVGQPQYAWYVPLWKGMLALLDGRHEEAWRAADEALATGRRAGSDNAKMLSTVLRYMCNIQTGLRSFTEMAEMRELVNSFAPHAMTVFDASDRALHGDVDNARRLIEQLDTIEDKIPWDAEWTNGMCQWAEAVAAAGDRDRAPRAYEVLLPYRHRFAVEGIGAATHGSIERFLGMLAACLGRTDDAIEHFEAAIRANERAGAALVTAITQRLYAELLSDHLGSRAEELLAASRGTLQRLGIEESRREAPIDYALRLEGEFWTLIFDGRVARVRNVKGVGDIATLVARTGRDVEAFDLVGAPEAPKESDTGEVLDATARREYTARIEALDEAMAAARALDDEETERRAATERDAIAEILSKARGLGGRARRTGDPVEKARTAVTWRIRDAIRRISEVHPEAGQHFRAAIRTGRVCSYAPDSPIEWIL